jgi:hypothetical protein
MSLEQYVTAWTETQYHALIFQKLYPQRVHIVRYEDVIADPRATLGKICEKLDAEPAESLGEPTWNSNPLEEVYPWGTIRKATAAANKTTAEELSKEEIERVAIWTDQYLDVFDYRGIM